MLDGKKNKSFYRKEVRSEEELLDCKRDDLVIYDGLNEKSTISNDTDIIIIGTRIPYSLDYFYLKSRNMYRWIDASRNTNLDILRKNTKSINEIIRILKHERIAFSDICKKILVSNNSSSDDAIVAFISDKKLLNYLSKHKNIEIIANSRSVETYFKRKMPSLNVKYYHYFRGGRGHHISDDEEKWIELFNKFKKRI